MSTAPRHVRFRHGAALLVLFAIGMLGLAVWLAPQTDEPEAIWTILGMIAIGLIAGAVMLLLLAPGTRKAQSIRGGAFLAACGAASFAAIPLVGPVLGDPVEVGGKIGMGGGAAVVLGLLMLLSGLFKKS